MTGYRDMTFCDAAERWWGREMKFNEEGFKDILRSYGLSDYGIEEVKRQLIRDALRWKHQADSSEPGETSNMGLCWFFVSARTLEAAFKATGLHTEFPFGGYPEYAAEERYRAMHRNPQRRAFIEALIEWGNEK